MLKKITNVTLVLVFLVLFSTPIATAEQEEELEIITVHRDRYIGRSGFPPLAFLRNIVQYYSNQGYVDCPDGLLLHILYDPSNSVLSFSTQAYLSSNKAYYEVGYSFSNPMQSESAVWKVWGDADGNSGEE